MSLRETIEQHRSAVLGAAGASALLAFAYVAWSFATSRDGAPRQVEPQAYFYDLHSGELFIAPADTIGAIDRPGGPVNGHPAGVRAQVFACGQCSDASQRFVGWLEIDGEEIGNPPVSEEDDAIYVRRVDDSEWVSAESTAGQRIANEAMSQCSGGGRVNFCRPEHEIK